MDECGLSTQTGTTCKTHRHQTSRVPPNRPVPCKRIMELTLYQSEIAIITGHRPLFLGTSAVPPFSAANLRHRNSNRSAEVRILQPPALGNLENSFPCPCSPQPDGTDPPGLLTFFLISGEPLHPSTQLLLDPQFHLHEDGSCSAPVFGPSVYVRGSIR